MSNSTTVPLSLHEALFKYLGDEKLAPNSAHGREMQRAFSAGWQAYEAALRVTSQPEFMEIDHDA